MALGISTNYSQLNVKESVQSPDKSWSSVSLALGPQCTIPLNRFFIQFNGNLGVRFIKTPALSQQQAGKPGYYEDDMTIFELESSQRAGFSVGGDFMTGVNLADKIRLFAGIAYNTNLNKAITYKHRDLSSAVHPSGEVYVNVINSTPFEKKDFSFSE